MKAISRLAIVVLALGCQGVAPAVSGTGESLNTQQPGGQSVQRPETVQRSQYLNIEGTLKEINGDMYILEATSLDKTVQVHVGGDTAFPNGQKEPGQSVQALVVASTRHALIIR